MHFSFSYHFDYFWKLWSFLLYWAKSWFLSFHSTNSLCSNKNSLCPDWLNFHHGSDWNQNVSDKPNGSSREAGRYDDCELAPRHGIAAVFVRDLSNEITAEPGFQIDVIESHSYWLVYLNNWDGHWININLKIYLSPVVLHVVINRPIKVWDSLLIHTNRLPRYFVRNPGNPGTSDREISPRNPKSLKRFSDPLRTSFKLKEASNQLRRERFLSEHIRKE